MDIEYDIAVIGGGPAGLAAAAEAKKKGAQRVVILERETRLGGILLQCIHNGFGLHHFGEELTGPEYAGRFTDEVLRLGIEYKTNTTVLGARAENGKKTVCAINTEDGVMDIHAKALVFATGCRERTRGALVIPGTRPAGIFTAGSVQRFVNIDGYLPGKKAVILGSGDIGLIMARRLTLEGAEVKLICEVMPFSAGLTRNIVQCVENFSIPLRFNHTITEIHGKQRVEGVTVSQVDKNRKPLPGTQTYVECDTLILSVGLIPENEISAACGIAVDSGTSGPVVNEHMETSVPGVFACGNAVHVHDLVDFVTEESIRAGAAAASFVLETHKDSPRRHITIRPGNRVRYTVPQSAEYPGSGPVIIMFRVTDVYRDVRIVVYGGAERLKTIRKKIVRPGEMLSVELTAEQMSRVQHSMTVAVEIPEEDID